MQLECENIEEIKGLSPFINWIETPPPIVLCLLPEHPALNPEALSGFFSPREQAEGRQKSSPAAFRAWFLGRLAAKAAVGRRLGRPPAQAEILKGPQGRPELSDGGQVSISHTGGAAAAAAGPQALGLDLERRDRVITERLRRWAFSGPELELAEAAPAPWPGALALWCAREAGAKAWGRGLLNHLEQVRVTGADWAVGRLRVAWLGPDPTSIGVDLLIPGDYLLALAGAARSRPNQQTNF